MRPDRFAQVKGLVLRVADLSADERRIALDDACRDDSDLRHEVESLLAHQDHATEVLKTQSVLMTEIRAVPSPAVRIGQTIGHYSITEFRGEGGMGEVYKAEDTRLKRSVALKFVRRDLVASERLKTRFIEEARAAAALDHPNICTVHAIEEWEGQLFLVMAFVEGETLKDRIARGLLGLSEILSIAVHVATGLEAAHVKGIVHRDIKSANIILSVDQRALIVDFGLARSARRPEGIDSGAMMGTAAYMSPEQSLGRALDPRTDIWSFGVVLYEMITGRLPFTGESERAITHALREEVPESCRTLRPDTPPELERIVGKALAKTPDVRYANATELLADLAALRRRSDPLRRRLRISLIAAGAVVAVMAGLLVLEIVVRGLNAPPPRTSMQVTSGDTWEGEPALSPDGKRVAYASDETGTSEIYLVDVDGRNSTQLTHGAPSHHPAWFPDEGALVFDSESGVGTDILKVSTSRAGTGKTTLLLPHASNPAISPDGRRIAFVRTGPSAYSRIFVASITEPADSVMLTHDGEGTWDHTNPAWSPDGRRICYEASLGLWIVPATGGAARQLTENEPDMEPLWTNDGRSIYFASYRGGRETPVLWRVDASGDHPQKLTPGSDPASHPSLTSDGAALAYTTGLTGRETFVVDRTTGRRARVPGAQNSLMGAIAPDGSSMVYQATRGEGRYDLWIQRLRDGRPSGDSDPLTNQPGIPSHPTFSHDGRWIAYYVIRNGQRDVWVIPAAGGTPVRFTEDPASQNQQPAWSPDGKLLAYISARGGGLHIWVAPIAGGKRTGKPIQITRGDLNAYHPAWSLDGKEIAFVGRQGDEQEVWLVRSDGSKPPYRVTSGGSVTVVRWDPAGDNLLVAGLWGGTTMVVRSVSLKTGATLPEAASLGFGSEHSPGMFDISADGRWLIYPDERDEGDVWVFEGKKGSY